MGEVYQGRLPIWHRLARLPGPSKCRYVHAGSIFNLPEDHICDIDHGSYLCISTETSHPVKQLITYYTNIFLNLYIIDNGSQDRSGDRLERVL